MGLRPEALFLVRAPGDDALWAAEEALRCPAVACVVTEIGDRRRGIDLTESRRLALAAEAGGAIGLLLRPDAREISPTAVTRWRISAVPGTRRVEHELGDAGCRVELLKARGAATPAAWDVAWPAQGSELALLGAEASDGEGLASRKRHVG
jgi:protein ImuA